MPLVFFSFVFLFEFILLITEKLSERYTHEEPWLIMLFKVIIILLLTPLHHLTQEKALHYFYEHKLIDTSRHPLRAGMGHLRTWLEKKKTSIMKD